MKIQLKSGISFDTEPDITILIGANSARIDEILRDIKNEYENVIFRKDLIVIDEDDLRVSPTLIDNNHWKVALFYCPDAYIHFWKFHKIYEILKVASQNKKIILTTFNPIFLNFFETRMVRVVGRFQGVFECKPIMCDKRFEKALEAYDGDLGELWYTNHFGGNPHK